MSEERHNEGTYVAPIEQRVFPPRLASHVYPEVRALVREARAHTSPMHAGFWVVDAGKPHMLGFVSAVPVAHAVLGRHSDVDLRVSDAQTTVSLRHALLRARRVDGDLTLDLLDLDSPNGVVLHDGRSVRGLSARGPFAAQLGSALFFFVPDEPGYELPDALPSPELHGIEPRPEPLEGRRGHGLVRVRAHPSGRSRPSSLASVICELPAVRTAREGSFFERSSLGTAVSVDLPAAEDRGATAFDVSLDGESLGALVLTPAQLRAGVLLGRYPRCWDLGDRPLPHSVSRVHTLLIRDGDALRALDLGSTNGTLVEDACVRSVVVRPNLSIGLGDDLSLSALFVG